MDETPLCMGILIEEGTGADRLMTPLIEFVSIRIPIAQWGLIHFDFAIQFCYLALSRYFDN